MINGKPGCRMSQTSTQEFYLPDINVGGDTSINTIYANRPELTSSNRSDLSLKEWANLSL